MTNEQLKQALLSKCPVTYRGTPYKCVSAIVYRNIDGEITTLAELTDLNAKNSLIYAEPHFVEEVKQ